MVSHTESDSLEPDLFGVVRDRWIIIAFLTIALALAGLFVGSTRDVEWTSTASVVVEDPRSSALFESGASGKEERYTQTQIGIIRSPAVAERASEILSSASPPIELAPELILEGSLVSSEQESDLISVVFTADSARVAESTADAIISAYLELRSAQAIAGFSSALDQLDESIVQAQGNLDDITQRIQATRGTAMASLEAEAEEALARLIELQDSENPDPDEISALSEQLSALETVIRIDNQRPELDALLEEQTLAMARLSDLVTRRNEVAVDAELAGGGFVFKNQATSAERIDPSPRAFGAVGAIVGLMGGVAVAYALAIWRRRVSSSQQPERILRSPALGTIPEFDVSVNTPLPVANAPQSRSAEAFRLVMTAIDTQLYRSDASRQGTGDRLVLFASTSAQDGRSTLVANIAIAAVRSGKRVLVVDSDFASQGVTKLLLPRTEEGTGLTEVVVGLRTLDSVIETVPIASAGELFLLSRGSDLMAAQDVFGSQEAEEVFNKIRERYDLVLVDSPPLPQVGYVTTLAGLVDRVLVVVRHRTQVSRLEELQRRLRLIQSRELGYVYNRAPATGNLRRADRQTARSTTGKSNIESATADTEMLQRMSDM